MTNLPVPRRSLRADTDASRRRLLAVFALAALTGCATPAEPGPPREIVATYDGQPVLVQLPPADLAAPDGGWPVMLFLHGLGERGTEIDRVRHHNTPPGAYPNLPALHARVILVTPQMNPDWRQWDIDWVRAALDAVLDDQPADRTHLLVTGLSVGGNATWDFLTRYPEEVTAAASFAGVAPESIVDPLVRPLAFTDAVPLLTPAESANPALATTPFLDVHCVDDAHVPYDQAARMVDALQHIGHQTAAIVPVPDCLHGSWPDYYLATALLPGDPERSVYDWLLAYVEGEEGRPLN